MQRRFYLKPLGPFPSPAVAGAEDAEIWRGLPLAGSNLSFSAVEVIERDGSGAKRRGLALGDFTERDWGQGTLSASDLLEGMTAPRARLAGLTLDRPRIMGIVNVTPDSFSDGGNYDTVDSAIAHALSLADAGADILDIGGESTRPGSNPVPLHEEMRRVLPVLNGLRAKTDKLISIDTRKAEVMLRAHAAGADIINDVSALTHDPKALETAATTGLPVILMHAQGDPKTMNDDPQYSDVVLDVFDFLERRIQACMAAGIPKAKIVVDPGIGFGKHLHHNIEIMAGLSVLHGLGVPILLGTSRKKMIGQLCDVPDPADRMPGSIATVLAAAAQGVQIMRVHDVAQTWQALMVWQASVFGREAAVSID